MKYVRKFKLSTGTLIVMIILTVFCIVFSSICSYFLNIDEEKLKNITSIDVVVISTIKDIFVIITSIVSTNLLLNLLIDVRTKNNLVTDIILNDVISDPEFYEKMDYNNKVNMCNALETELYFKNEKNREMFNYIQNKLKNIDEKYYYKSCNYVVTCNVKDQYIEKEITRKVVIKSFSPSYTIKELCISNFSSKKVHDLESYELLSLEVNGEKIDLNSKYIKLQPLEMCNLDEQNEYNINNRYVYTKPIKINNNIEIPVVVKCLTRTTIDDKTSTFRVSKPCEKFSLIYTLDQQDKFRLAVDAFGFLDDANGTANNNSKSNINITFENWIFKYDGVVVSILDSDC